MHGTLEVNRPTGVSMRLTASILALSLCTACAEDAPAPAADAEPAAEAARGDGTRATTIRVSCADSPCDELWITVDPPPLAPLPWIVNGEDWPPEEGFLFTTPEPGEVLEISAFAEDGTQPRVAIMEIVDEEGSGYPGYVVILGNQNDSCEEFYIESVGGCVSQDRLVFRPFLWGVFWGWNKTVAFDRLVAGNNYLGHAYYARGPIVMGSSPPSGGLPPQLGYDYWFALSEGQRLDVKAYHGSVLSSDVLPPAACIGGTPIVGASGI